MTFGIKPSKPETGYGYIEFEGDNVLTFHEKKTKDKAVEFLQKDNFYWNSGMFCFKASVFLEEFKILSQHPWFLLKCSTALTLGKMTL